MFIFRCFFLFPRYWDILSCFWCIDVQGLFTVYPFWIRFKFVNGSIKFHGFWLNTMCLMKVLNEVSMHCACYFSNGLNNIHSLILEKYTWSFVSGILTPTTLTPKYVLHLFQILSTIPICKEIAILHLQMKNDYEPVSIFSPIFCNFVFPSIFILIFQWVSIVVIYRNCSVEILSYIVDVDIVYCLMFDPTSINHSLILRWI